MARNNAPKYNIKLAESILNDIAGGMTIAKALQKKGRPSTPNFYEWLRKYPTFREAYKEAQEIRAHTMADQVIDIADDDSLDEELGSVAVSRAKERAAARKWLASKLAPRSYGDNKHVEIEQNVNVHQLPTEELTRKINELAEHLGFAGKPGRLIEGRTGEAVRITDGTTEEETA